jgi:hypothetical protein
MIHSNFKILKDKPIERQLDDLFGYEEIAKNISVIIKKANPPFTVGIYGKWGTGKTSICNLVKEEFKDNKDFKVFYFDVWKYEKDSFRRQFLIQLDENLDLNLNYKNTLNQSLNKPVHPDLKELIKIIFQNTALRIIGIIIITCVLILLFSVFQIYKIENLSTLLSILLLSILSQLGILGTFITFLLEGFKITYGNIQVPRLDSAEGFEDRFKDVLQNKKIKNKKLLIIIDNLDRLTHSKAVEILSDIKTFLAKENDENKTMFLIPCDDESILKHLESVYGEKFDANEFLRKFFNLTFRIPKILDLELDKYILEKLGETNIEEFNNPDLAFVIMQAFRDNPREIIQFINSLIASYNLAKIRNLKPVLENLPFLAKILVIRQKWPIEYSKIENEVIRTGLSLYDAVNKLETNEKVNLSDLRKFLQEKTSTNDSKILDPFFTLYESEYEKKLPESKSFIISCEEKRVDDAKKIYEYIKKTNKIDILDGILTDYVRKNQENHTKISYIFITLTKIVNAGNELANFPYFLSSLFAITGIKSKLIKFSEDIKFESIINKEFLDHIKTKKIISKKIIEAVIELLENKKDGKVVIPIKIGFKIFKLISQEDVYGYFKNRLNNLTSAKIDLISSFDITSNEVGSESEHNRLEEFIRFIENTKPLDSVIIFYTLTNTYQKFLSSGLRQNIEELKWKVYASSERLLRKIDKSLNNSYIESINMDEFVSIISNEYRHIASINDWEKANILINIFLELKNFTNENQTNSLKDCIKDFIIRAPLENIEKSISRQEMLILINEISDLKQEIIRKSYQKWQIILEYDLKKNLENDEIYSILKQLLNNSNFEGFINLSKYFSYKPDFSGKADLITNCISKLIIVPTNLLGVYLEILNKWGIPPGSNFGAELINVKNQDIDKANIILNFVKKNRKLFGEPELQELLKKVV